MFLVFGFDGGTWHITKTERDKINILSRVMQCSKSFGSPFDKEGEPILSVSRSCPSSDSYQKTGIRERVSKNVPKIDLLAPYLF